ncbi:hypothetical protein GCM10009718_04360 [Isoptericola halotolerans]
MGVDQARQQDGVVGHDDLLRVGHPLVQRRDVGDAAVVDHHGSRPEGTTDEGSPGAEDLAVAGHGSVVAVGPWVRLTGIFPPGRGVARPGHALCPVGRSCREVIA